MAPDARTTVTLDDDVARAVERAMQTSGAVVVEPAPRHAEVLGALLKSSGTGGDLVADAYLASLAIERELPVCPFDRDVARFEGVRLVRPR